MRDFAKLAQLVALRRDRESLGVKAAASQIGVPSSILSKVEQGHIPDLENLELICDWLAISPCDVLGAHKNLTLSQHELRVHGHYKKKKVNSPHTMEAFFYAMLAAKRVLRESAKEN